MNRLRSRAADPQSISWSESTRIAHYRRSMNMTLITFAIGIALFTLFFGLVAACDRL